MSVAFTREESAETAAEVELPDRPISPHPNLVTASGLEARTNAMRESRTAYDAAQRIQDAAERRRAVAIASRDMRYFAERLRTAQLVPPARISAPSLSGIEWHSDEATAGARPSGSSGKMRRILGMDQSRTFVPSRVLWSAEPRVRLSWRATTRSKFSPSCSAVSPEGGDAVELTSAVGRRHNARAL
jgi:hypothetical protein